jgi:putative flippase GtrA
MSNVVENFRSIFGRYGSVRYVLVGILNTSFSYIVYALLIFLGTPIAWASLGALLMGILWSYSTHGKIVFKHLSKTAFVKFVINWIVIYVLNVQLIYKLMEWDLNAYTAAAVATIPVTIISYFSLKYLVFKD